MRAFVAVLCLLVLLTLFAIHTPPARRYAVNRVSELLARQHIEFNTDELGYNIFGASLSLRNIRIRSTTLPDAPVFATIGRARINLSLPQLLRGRYVVQSGTVDDVDIHYFVDEQGRDNVPRPPTDPDQPSKPLDYLVDALTVTNAHVRYENRAEQIDAQLPISSIDVDGNNLTDRHQIRIEAAAGQVHAQDRTIAIDRLTGDVDLGKDDVSIDRVDVESLGSRAEVTGTISQFTSPVADLAVKATMDATRVAPLANVDEPVNGIVTIDATAKGPLATPAINAHVSSSELQFRDLRQIQLDAVAAYDLATRRADVSSFDVRGPWGGVTGKGNVAVEGPGSSNLQAQISGADAGAIMRALRLPFVAATRIDGTVQAEWPGLEYLKAKGKADARLRPTASEMARSAMPIGGRLLVEGNGGRIDARLVQIEVPGAELNGQVGVTSDRRLQGQVKGNASDVGRLASSIEAFTGRPKGSLLPTPVSGGAQLDAKLSGSLSEPTASTVLNAPALTVGKADDIALNAAASYSRSALTIERADLTWKEARAHLDGRIGLNPGQPIDVKFTADNLDVPAVLQAANQPDLPITGTFAARGTVGGTLARPMALLTAQGTDLVAYEEQVGSLKADIRLDGREVAVPELVIDKPQPDKPGRITASGTYHLDREAYTVDVKSQDVRLLGLLLPNGKHIRGDVQLAAKGAGTVSAPEGTADLTVDALAIEGMQSQPAAGQDAAGSSDLGRIVVSAVAKNNEATIKVSAERFNLDADALVGLTRPWPTTVKVRAENLDLAALPTEAAPEAVSPTLAGLEGMLRATIDASGNLSEPEKGQATVALDTFNGKWNGRPFTVTSPSPIRYADERLGIEKLEVAVEDASLTVSGELPLTDAAGEGEIAVDLHGNLSTVTPFLPPDVQVAADGAIALTGALKGTLTRIDPDLTLTLERGLILTPLLEPGFSNIRLRARINDGEANIEQLSGNWGTATLDGSGRIPLEAVPPLPVEIPRMGGPATFKATVRGLDPSAIPGAPPQLSGIITVNAELSADRPELSALAGQVTFQELEIAFSGLGLAQQQPSRIVIAKGAAQVEQLALSGSAGAIKAGGRVEMVGDQSIDVNVDGNLNVAAVSVVTRRIRAEGDSALKLMARGTLSAPEVTGTIDIMKTNIVSDEPNVAAQNLNAHVDLNGSRIELARLRANVNGGTMNAAGFLTVANGEVTDIDIEMSTQNFAYDAPLDLRSISDSTIRVTRRDENFIVSGKVTIDEAGLTGDFNFDTGLLAAMTARRRLDLTEERNPFLERVQFDINVNTASPILVNNNLGRAEIEADLHVVGTPYETGLLGELTLVEGSEIRLNERRYEAERGVITFVDERRIFPSFDLRLNTTAGAYEISILVTGTPGETETTLTSDPILPEPDIMAVLVTGRTLDQMRGEEYDVAREQVLSYMAGRVGSSLGRGLQQATGFTEVRVEPTLIASEADPSARLTIGQDLTDELKLVYSTSLTDSNDQIWIAEYDVSRRFQTRAVRQEDNSYRVDFHHDVRFGGMPEPRRSESVRPKVAEINVTDAEGNEAAARETFGVKVGDHYDFFKIRNATERLEKSLMDQGYLESRVRVGRRVRNQMARLNVRVMRGPMVVLTFDGTTLPKSVQDEVRTQWHRGVFDKQRGDDSVDAIREWLMSDKYFQPKIEYRIEDVNDDRRNVVFQIQPGAQSRKVVLAFEGASGINPDELRKVIADQNLERQLFTDPIPVTQLLQRYYREQGYMAAEIDEPRFEYGEIARIVLPVHEGPKFSVRRVSVSGNHVYTTDVVIGQLPVLPGQPYLPAAAERALDKIRDLYWSKGYNDVKSDYDLVVDRGAGEIDIKFSIKEGPQSVIAGITYAGNDRVSEHLLSEQVMLVPTEPLDLSVLAKSRRNLYDTGAFSLVNIRRRELEGDEATKALAVVAASGHGSDGSQAEQNAGPSASAQPPAPAGEQKPVAIEVAVREVQPFQIRYGASYDTERAFGGVLDISNHNSLGGARELGLRSRYDRQVHDARIYINQPALNYLPKTTGTLYIREELNPQTEITDPFDVSRKGVSIQQEKKLRDFYVLTYGYRFERAHRLTPVGPIIIDEAYSVSPVTTTVTRETRDEVLDASKGDFLSQAFSYSPSWLGADTPYIKYYGQYYHYFPLQSEKRKPFTNEILRTRLVYAVGVRLGLSRGIGGDLVPRTERFFAGGGQSMRGFAQNAVGPIGPDRGPLGGEAMLVINNEVRFPLPLLKLFDGVLFTDIGNVYPRVRDLSLTDIRESVGVGLRVRTPWVLLRGDYGIVVDPRPGEPRSRFYISIGQAF